MTAREIAVMRDKLIRLRTTLMDDGWHFPNEELVELDECIVTLGGRSENPELTWEAD